MKLGTILVSAAVAALAFSATPVDAAPHGGGGAGAHFSTSGGNRFGSRYSAANGAAAGRWNGNWRGRGGWYHGRGYYYGGYYPFYWDYPWGWYGYPYYYGAAGYYDYDPNAYGYGYGYGNGAVANRNGVVAIQQRLARAGYYHGRIDGVMGEGTRTAIRNYQRSHGMPANGRISEGLLRRLGAV